MGDHDICHRTIDTMRAEFRAALEQEQVKAGADRWIANYVRMLLLPGSTRRMIRVSELANIVANADARAER